MVVRIAGLRLPEGLRRSLPQRRRARGAAGHSRPRDRVPVAPRRRRRRCCETCVAAAKVDGSVCVYPRADRAVPRPRSPTRTATTCGPPSRVAITFRVGAARTHLRRRTRPDDRDVGKRAADVAARRPTAARARRRRARRRPPLACAAADRRHPAGGRRRPAACSSSTRPVTRAASAKGSSPSSSTRGYRRRAGPRVEQGLVHPARRRRTPRPGFRGRDRGGGGASAGPLGPLPCPSARSRCSWSRPSSRAAQRRSTIQTTMPTRATTVLKIRTSVTPPSSFPGAGGETSAPATGPATTLAGEAGPGAAAGTRSVIEHGSPAVGRSQVRSATQSERVPECLVPSSARS